MKLIRALLNIVILTVYLVRKTLFVIARVFGSAPGAIAICGATIVWIEHNHQNPVIFYVPLFFAAVCRVAYPYLRVRSGPGFLRAPAAPAPPPPIASTAKGRADDPNEATVIGRLDPKLRELLRQKPDASAS